MADDDWLDSPTDELDESDDPEPDNEPDGCETVPCPACGVEVYEDALACPACGHYLTSDTSPWSGRPAWWVLLGLLGIVALVCFLLRG